MLSQVLRFGVVGTIGFLVDGGVLVALVELGANPYVARLISFPIAVLATWALNRNWTFRTATDQTKGRQFGRYFGVQLVGVGVNYSVYVVALGVLGTSSAHALVALAIGSIAGMVLNFLGARFLVFPEPRVSDT